MKHKKYRRKSIPFNAFQWNGDKSNLPDWFVAALAKRWGMRGSAHIQDRGKFIFIITKYGEATEGIGLSSWIAEVEDGNLIAYSDVIFKRYHEEVRD